MKIIQPFPEMNKTAFYGVLGRSALKLSEYTEASATAILLHLVVGIGNMLGKTPYYIVDAKHHHTNLFVVIVGDTAKSRKGTSWSMAKWLLQFIAPRWLDRCCITGGITTGPGILWRIRDVISDKDHGIDDKRALFIEEEFAKVLRLAKDRFSTLADMFRCLWDSDRRYDHIPRRGGFSVTNPHVSFVGHITNAELTPLMQKPEILSGFGNRFLWILVTRGKIEPRPKRLNRMFFDKEIGELKAAIKTIKGKIIDVVKKERDVIPFGAVNLSDKGEESWDKIYNEIEVNYENEKVNALSVRAAPYIARIAMIFAMLDGKPIIEPRHLEAAKAIWDYHIASVKYIFGTTTLSQKAVKLGDVLREARELTKSQVNLRVYSNHAEKGEIDRDIEQYVRWGLVTVDKRTNPNADKPTTVYMWNGEAEHEDV